MKKTIISICALLALAGGAKADDAFSVDNVTLPQNGEADVTVRFSLDEGSTCSGYTFWLQVPEELAFVTYEKNSKTYITYTAGDCYDETPTLTPNIDGGYLKVGCLTANSDPLNKQSGALVTFRLKVNGTVNVGDVLTGTLTNGTISAENGTVHDVADATFTVTIGEPADTRTILDETSTTAPEAATGVDVRVKRTIKANEWSTICLPFAMTEAQVKTAFGEDVQLGDFKGYEATTDDDDNVVGLTVKFEDASAIEANHPYIIKVTAAVSEFTVDGVDIDPEDEPTVAAVKRTKKQWSEMTGTYVAGTELEATTLFLNGNKFWYSAGNTKMKAYRAYFDFYDVLTEVEEAYSSRIAMTFSDGTTTGIRGITNDELRITNAVYDLQGRRVSESGIQNSELRKGLYIVNGKKVVNK